MYDSGGTGGHYIAVLRLLKEILGGAPCLHRHVTGRPLLLGISFSNVAVLSGVLKLCLKCVSEGLQCMTSQCDQSLHFEMSTGIMVMP